MTRITAKRIGVWLCSAFFALLLCAAFFVFLGTALVGDIPRSPRGEP